MIEIQGGRIVSVDLEYASGVEKPIDKRLYKLGLELLENCEPPIGYYLLHSLFVNLSGMLHTLGQEISYQSPTQNLRFLNSVL
jgi:hypothetical protein